MFHYLKWLPGIWLLMLQVLLWTTDIQEGPVDIRINFLCWFCHCGMSDSHHWVQNNFAFILYLFVFSVLWSLVSIAVLNGLIPTKAPISIFGDFHSGCFTYSFCAFHLSCSDRRRLVNVHTRTKNVWFKTFIERTQCFGCRYFSSSLNP